MSPTAPSAPAAAKQSDTNHLPPEVVERHKAYLRGMDNSQVRGTCSEVAGLYLGFSIY